jgi:tetratricopeptide (TPR) repeat protein
MFRMQAKAKDFLMRYAPAGFALSLLASVTSSISLSAPTQELDPRAAALIAQGRSAMAAGEADRATDFYEAALVIQPGSVQVLLNLAEAGRRQGMQGKALRYYREALAGDPGNVHALAGEGTALAEKGALERARRNLARLKDLCGENCEATRRLANAIAKGPAPRVVTAEAVKPEPVVSEN